jgi:hypothetical protein
MAAQALCEPATEDATRLFDNFKPGFYRLSQDMKHREYLPVIIWAQLAFSAMEYLGS